MMRAELLGQHSHLTTCGIEVHVWLRDGKYLARGYFQRRQFGKNLGSDPVVAASLLRHLLTDIENGTFLPPAEARRRPIKTTAPPAVDLRQLCAAYVAEKRKLRGKRTASDYLSRLIPAIIFAEQPASRRRWPLAKDLHGNREFAVELRAFLASYLVTRNGRPGTVPKPMSPRQILNVLSTLRSAMDWAHLPGVNLLPLGFANPLTPDIVGQRPAKDPLRVVKVSLERRIELVRRMDRWQLCQLSLFLVLPMRPDEEGGLLVNDVDFSARVLRFGTRLGGRDFNKARQDFQVPFPGELVPILEACVGGRSAGPLLRSRECFGGRKPKIIVSSLADVEAHFERVLSASTKDVQSEQDAKLLFRGVLRDMGAASPDALRGAFKQLVSRLGWEQGLRLYELRGSVMTEMHSAGVPELELRYLTGRSIKDSLYDYVSLNPVARMVPYFERIRPLLVTIADRFRELTESNRRIAA